MDIKRAKDEIKKSIEIYLAKTPQGEYKIPITRQRPIILMGPPGVGKTAVMEQIARECKICFVSYTMTHHTRESILGMPHTEKIFYKKESFVATEYSLSEIIASIYQKISDTGIQEGILFLDEINCVSESLAPSMLQFLQGKTFNNHQIPEGWIVVAAGNPPEYNASVREFDVVTLDRLKKIDIEPDYVTWKEYAYGHLIHGSIISFLELNPDCFYDVRPLGQDKKFITARGWEDLSAVLVEYEARGYTIDEQFILEYVQHPEIAHKFFEHYEKYSVLLPGSGIEAPSHTEGGEILLAHVLSNITNMCNEVDLETQYINAIDGMVQALKKQYGTSRDSIRTIAGKIVADVEDNIRKRLSSKLLTGNELAALRGSTRYIMEAAEKFSDSYAYGSTDDEAFAELIKNFENLKAARETLVEDTINYINTTFNSYEDFDRLKEEIAINELAVKFLNEYMDQ